MPPRERNAAFQAGLKASLDSDPTLFEHVSLRTAEGAPGTIFIHHLSVASAAQGVGRAGRVLTRLEQLADQCGVDLKLTPEPLAPGLSVSGLAAWYQRHGFEPDGQNSLRRRAHPFPIRSALER